MKKVLLVTGANRGIGYAICEKVLKEKLPYRILMTTRNEVRGMPSLRSLQEKYPEQRKEIDLLQLDISDKGSVNNFAKTLQQKCIKVDSLVNNAGIMYLADNIRKDSRSFLARDVMNVNFTSTVEFTDKIKPF